MLAVGHRRLVLCLSDQGSNVVREHGLLYCICFENACIDPSVVDARLVPSFVLRTVSTTIKTSTAVTLLGTLAAWRSIVVGGPTRGLRG